MRAITKKVGTPKTKFLESAFKRFKTLFLCERYKDRLSNVEVEKTQRPCAEALVLGVLTQSALAHNQ